MSISDLKITSSPLLEKDGISYIAYIIEYINHQETVIAVSKRYNEFYEFRVLLEYKGFLNLPILPNKTLIKSYDSKFINERIELLNIFLFKLSKRVDISRSGYLIAFLEDQDYLINVTLLNKKLLPSSPFYNLKNTTFASLKLVQLYNKDKELRPDWHVIDTEEKKDNNWLPLIIEVQHFLTPSPISSAITLVDENALIISAFAVEPTSVVIANYLTYFANTIYESLYGVNGFGDQTLKSSNSTITAPLLFAYKDQASLAESSSFNFDMQRSLSSTLACNALSLVYDKNRRWIYVGMADGSLHIFNPSPDFSFSVPVGKFNLCKDALLDMELYSSPTFTAENDFLLITSKESIMFYSPHDQCVLCSIPIPDLGVLSSRFVISSKTLFVGTRSGPIWVIDFAEESDRNVVTPRVISPVGIKIDDGDYKVPIIGTQKTIYTTLAEENANLAIKSTDENFKSVFTQIPLGSEPVPSKPAFDEFDPRVLAHLNPKLSSQCVVHTSGVKTLQIVGDEIISGSLDGSFALIQYEKLHATGNPDFINVYGGRYSVTAMAYLTCDFGEPLITTGLENGIVTLWSHSGGYCKLAFPAHTDEIVSMQWIEKDSILMTSSKDCTTKYWKLEKSLFK